MAIHNNNDNNKNFYDFQDGDIPKVIEKRMNKITQQIIEGMKEMGIPSEITSEVSVIFNFKDITPNPNAKKDANGIIVEIPLLFLISPKDKELKSPVNEWFKKHLQQSILSQKDLINLQAFNTFLQKKTQLAKQAKKFVLYHELSHILYDDVSQPKVSAIESRKREALADLTAAKYSSALAGGIYLFEIMSKFSPKSRSSDKDSHPSFRERVEYLKQYNEKPIDFKI